jgi:hypothetical protein
VCGFDLGSVGGVGFAFALRLMRIWNCEGEGGAAWGIGGAGSSAPAPARGD